MSKSKIQWTEQTWNPVTGCTKYSEGCRHCYAEVMARRLQGMGLEKYRNGFNVALHPQSLTEPMLVNKPTMFFVCSMADLFHKDVPYSFVDNVMYYIALCPQHTFQILTKRAERMEEYFSTRPVLSNVWLGVSVEDENYTHRINRLKSIKHRGVKFLSCEPLLGDLGTLYLDGISWVIVGGESGSNARPLQKEWVLNIQRQCADQNVPFFFKQWGTWGEDGIKRNKKANGCKIDGVIYQEYPNTLKLINND